MPEGAQNDQPTNDHQHRPEAPPHQEAVVGGLPGEERAERPGRPGGSLYCTYFGLKLLVLAGAGTACFAYGLWGLGVFAWGVAALIGLFMRWR
ncbi:MAG: hypothetical protein QOJ97_1993, partial [Solirubrobacteraceae bacterium]|nr:hypothetical protein [Solirubrobacteraceae bacterium]